MYLALLRGINVGGNGRLPMKELAAIFTSFGATGVRTYIQSGNVIFDSQEPQACTHQVTAEIARQYGYPGRIVLLSSEDLLDVFVSNPFLKAGAPESTLHVYFLGDLPAPGAIDSLDPLRSPPDAFAVHRRAIYLHLPNGMARTKLTNTYFDTKLKTISTARNWTTVGKLLDLMQP